MNKHLITRGEYPFYVVRENEEVEVSISWQYWLGMKAPREYGCPMGPDDNGEFEIIKALDINNFEVDLTEEEESKIMDELAGIELLQYRED
jgi:hypothetical protein